MAQGKLSEQVSATQQEAAPTRTQRLRQQSEERKARERFEALRAEAERIQKEKFRDKVVEEKYTEYIPRDYVDRYGNPTRAWQKLSDKNRQRAIANTPQRDLVAFERTRQRTIPFTLDEGENSYEKVYDTLSSDLKQFFASPEELKQERTQRIQTNISKVDERISLAQSKLIELKEKYEREKQELQEWWQRKSSTYRSDPRNRKNYNENKDDLEEDYEEDREYQRGIIEGLQKGKSQLSEKKDVEYSDILNYAEDLGSYYEDRKEARTKARKQEQIRVKAIEDAIKEAQSGGRFERVRESFKGKDVAERIYAVSPSGKYTLISEQKPKYNVENMDFAKPSELGKARVAQQYKIGTLSLKFEGTEPLYKTKSGSLITSYGDLGVTESDLLKQQQEEAQKQRQLREAQADAYLMEKQFEGKVSAEKPEEKRSFLGKTFDYLKAGYASTLFGTSVRMPDEYLEQRKKIGVTMNLGLPQLEIYSLDFGTALKGVKAEREKKREAETQVELITELDKLTTEAPEELQYDVQQKGLKLLEQRGVRTNIDEKTGVINFASDAFKPSKSYNIYEFEKAKEYEAANVDKLSVLEFTSPERKENISLPYQQRGTAFYDPNLKQFKANTTEITIPAKTTTVSPYSVGVGTRIAATKAVEIFLISKGAGAILGGLGKVGGGIYKGLGGGLKVTDATIRAGKVTATVEPTLTAKILAGKTGTVLKATGTGVLLLGAGSLYTLGKVKQREEYIASFGETGRQVFKYETIGELAGLGALFGEGAYKKAQIRKANEQIALKNYQRQLRAEQLRNVKQYGQFSDYAEVSYKGGGAGRKLKKSEVDQLARIYAEATGTTRQQASRRIQEGALFKQTLKVGSPVNKAYRADQYTVLTSTKTPKGSQEIALEFTKVRGGKAQNVVLKLTTGKGKYAFTSVFEKARLRPTQTTDEFVLQKTVASKIIKSRGTQYGEVKLRQFLVEQRLIKSFPTGRTRYNVKDAVELGLAKYNQGDIARVFARAGKGSRISPLPLQNVRYEFPLYRDVGGGIKVADVREFRFVQGGRGGRQIALKNILKDIDFKNLERALRGSRTKTPFSKTFAEEPVVTQFTTQRGQQDVRQIALKNVMKAAEADRIASLPRSVGGGGKVASQYAGRGLYESSGEAIARLPKTSLKNIDISPTISGDLKIRIIDKLIPSVSVSTSAATSAALALALKGALGLRSREQLKAELRVRQLTNQVEVQRTRQEQGQQQTQAQRSAQISIPTFNIPNINLTTINPTTTTTTRPTPPIRPFIFGTDDRLLKKLLKRRKGEQGIDVAYLVPDFASRALGIEPVEVGSEKEALKAINRVQTGLELRRGIRIRA